MKYLGMQPVRLRVGVFDFTGCEGCQLQLANCEETLAAFLQAVEVVRFREISSEQSGAYDVALIDGSITRSDEVRRLQAIRKQAKTLVALGSCACFGGVSKLKNAFDLAAANREVYGDTDRETLPTRAVKEVVPVDLEIPGCPVSKAEVERIVRHLVWGIPYRFPAYPVCFECKQRYTVCRLDQGQVCLGPITRGGCGAPCPAGGLGCWGCRGPAVECNLESFLSSAQSKGLNLAEIQERLDLFGGFAVAQ